MDSFNLVALFGRGGFARLKLLTLAVSCIEARSILRRLRIPIQCVMYFRVTSNHIAYIFYKYSIIYSFSLNETKCQLYITRWFLADRHAIIYNPSVAAQLRRIDE